MRTEKALPPVEPKMVRWWVGEDMFVIMGIFFWPLDGYWRGRGNIRFERVEWDLVDEGYNSMGIAGDVDNKSIHMRKTGFTYTLGKGTYAQTCIYRPERYENLAT